MPFASWLTGTAHNPPTHSCPFAPSTVAAVFVHMSMNKAEAGAYLANVSRASYDWQSQWQQQRRTAQVVNSISCHCQCSTNVLTHSHTLSHTHTHTLVHLTLWQWHKWTFWNCAGKLIECGCDLSTALSFAFNWASLCFVLKLCQSCPCDED